MSCQHRTGIRKGEIICTVCRSRYVIDANGSRWVEPTPLQRPRAKRKAA